ncbi:MAG: DEAD/DEAH box helicase [Anaerolineales bacterium]|nr:DEAD/DEAH box helicase [Anaerolineales bacterium]
MQFKDFNLDSRLQRNLRAMGFEQPTPIQSAAIQHALDGKDILGSAETGTGKTAAFLLPLLQKMINTKRTRDPRALILTPTRELAIQVADHARQLSQGLPVRIATVYGGVGIGSQTNLLKKGVDLVVATPGRLLDHAGRRNVDFGSLQIFVLDEGDRMLDIGFMPDIRRIARLLPRERQTMLFSATLQAIDDLAREMTRDPVRIEVEKTVTPDAITQLLYPVPEHLKYDLLKNMLQDRKLDSVLLFTRTKHRADRIVKKLRRENISASVIHGNRSQSQRINALEGFRQGRTRVLVATDIAARGIDVDGISHVVNYDVPMQPEDYVHRIGRTGRAQSIGSAFTFVTPMDLKMIHRIERILKKKIERRTIDGLDYNQPAAQKPDAEAIRRYVEANRRKPTGRPARQMARG